MLNSNSEFFVADFVWYQVLSFSITFFSHQNDMATTWYVINRYFLFYYTFYFLRIFFAINQYNGKETVFWPLRLYLCTSTIRITSNDIINIKIFLIPLCTLLSVCTQISLNLTANKATSNTVREISTHNYNVFYLNSV